MEMNCYEFISAPCNSNIDLCCEDKKYNCYIYSLAGYKNRDSA